ncbi:MAG: hypothetical protein UV51_C0007G0011 [Candidatus Woesebacteria bacterium GW2011_GWC1_42_9]|nr:MAG: hypothetical protein UV51_C0007G0011 [Candidatus Woesebacteria bacterium GW2011_GWC1_42_9]
MATQKKEKKRLAAGRHVISQSKRRRHNTITDEVVYITKIGNHSTSRTVHEPRKHA